MSSTKQYGDLDHSETQITSHDRRKVMAGLAATTVVSAIPSGNAIAATVTIETFLKVSSLVTGITLNKTYIQLGELIWAAILKEQSARGRRQWERMIERLDRLPADATEAQMEGALSQPLLKKARQLAQVWYTGTIIKKDKSEIILTYDDALVWRACDWTKPAATCGGKFGYWAKPFQGKV
jgi:predicted nucleic acid-binding protein